MINYAPLLKDKFPIDERLSFYKFPALPAVKVGKLLASETRISSPNDIVGMHLIEGFFSSSYVIFTKDTCYYKGGSFFLEEARNCTLQEEECVVLVNQKGRSTEHKFPTLNADAAILIQKVFDNIRTYNPDLANNAPDYSQFEGSALDWLLLRDEVMKTIDMLYDKYNEGKLSLLEYESKKEELLGRL
ncbi:MAG: hypothetical protein ACKVTZ_15605 [Bacteroidia bacterium]